MLIVFASIVVLGVSSFIVAQVSHQEANSTKEKCLHLALAGLNYALYQYRQSGALASGQVNIDANNYFVLNTTGGGGAASSLIINATASSVGGPSNRDLLNVTLKNSSLTQSIIIDRAIVTWNLAVRRMQQIVIAGSTRWSGSVASPANVDITNFTLNPNTTYALTRIRWNASMNGRTITLQFVMSDGSITSVCTVLPTPAAACQTGGGVLTVRSMGKTSGSNIYRTIQASYDNSTGKVTSYNETNVSVP